MHAQMIDLRWHDACSASRAFTAEEMAGGWPDSMTPAQLASIQRPYIPEDAPDWLAQLQLCAALDSICRLLDATPMRLAALLQPLVSGDDPSAQRSFSDRVEALRGLCISTELKPTQLAPILQHLPQNDPPTLKERAELRNSLLFSRANEGLTLARLSAILRPAVSVGPLEGRAHWALCDALQKACSTGDIACGQEVKKIQIDPSRQEISPFAALEDLPDWYVLRHTVQPYTIESVVHRVAPSTFAAWLHMQEQDPSEHVAAWFKAKGVAWPPVAAADPAQGADARPFPLADWSALVAYRKANPGKDWGLGNQLDILRAELDRRMDGGKCESAALAEMAGELGNGSRQSLKKALSGERMRAKKKQATRDSTTVINGKKVDSKAA